MSVILPSVGTVTLYVGNQRAVCIVHDRVLITCVEEFLNHSFSFLHVVCDSNKLKCVDL